MNMHTKEAVILAGGFGTRLQSVVKDVPKPMAPVCGRPFLEYQLDYLRAFGIEKVVLSLGYLPEAVKDHFGYKYHDLEIAYAVETDPLGTGGAIAYAAEQIRGKNFWVFNGDSLFEVNLPMMEAKFFSAKADITLALRTVDDVSRYGMVETDEHSQITHFREKSDVKGPGTINGGVYLINKAKFLEVVPRGRFSVEKEVFMPDDRLLSLSGVVSDTYFIDIGIPEDYQRAQHEFITR
jgi:D-glycero-alpha-D-manno-heptose 1-phosphate guanylyltransferase